jgi:methionine-S-sulfoxide reductase
MSKTFVFALTGIVAFAYGVSPTRAQDSASANAKTAVFAGGCFWCMQKPYDQTSGVLKTVAGYSGGSEVNPTYGQVSGKKTGHREVIQVTYDPEKVSYDQLLDVFWRQINPTQADGQFADRGLPYKAAIFYANEEEKKLAEASKAKLAASGKFDKPIVTELLPAAPFYPAEEYHQMYYKKNAADYQAYYVGSGRAGFLEKTWGKQ